MLPPQKTQNTKFCIFLLKNDNKGQDQGCCKKNVIFR